MLKVVGGSVGGDEAPVCIVTTKEQVIILHYIKVAVIRKVLSLQNQRVFFML